MIRNRVQQTNFFRVVRNNGFDKEIYHLHLKVIPNKQYSISVTDTSNNKFTYVIDNILHVVYDIKQNNIITFSSDSSDKSFELILSKQAIEGDSFSNSLPSINKLYHNYANPFNPTTIRFWIETPSYARLKIYNVVGAGVQELLNWNINKGYSEIIFDGKDLPIGINFWRLITNKKTEIIKMLFLK